MKNKLKFLSILLLVIPFISIVAPANSLFTNKLCADTVVDPGVKCVDNPTDCSAFPGYKLAKDFFSSVTLKDMRVDEISNAFNSVYQNGLNTMCMSGDIGSIIPVYYGSAKSLTGSQNIAGLANAVMDIVNIPRACPIGWVPSQAKNVFKSANFGPSAWRAAWGCCPPGFDFINVKEQSFPDASNVGACAKSGLGASYLATEGGDSANGLYSSTGQLLVNFPARSDYAQYPSWSALTDDVKNNRTNWIWSYTNSDGTVAEPQVGQGLGPQFKDLNIDGQSPRIRTGPPLVGPTSICPKNTACAISTDTAAGAKNPDFGRVVPVSSLNNDANAVCNRCYTAGDTIGTSTPPNLAQSNSKIDQSVGFVRFCNADGSYKDETLIGTPDITRGYLLEEGQNQALYKECFDTGGIYTAIGCIDPTPTGIITGLIRISLGVMGGVALLQLIYVGILYQQGNTEKIKGARTQLIATLTGVAVLVFSVLILRIIGVNILDTVANGSV